MIGIEALRAADRAAWEPLARATQPVSRCTPSSRQAYTALRKAAMAS